MKVIMTKSGGDSILGTLLYAPEVGLKVYVFNGLNSVSTSEVKEVLEIENDHVVRFQTLNSQYTIQYL